jgi:hypothetical protein
MVIDVDYGSLVTLQQPFRSEGVHRHMEEEHRRCILRMHEHIGGSRSVISQRPGLRHSLSQLFRNGHGQR